MWAVAGNMWASMASWFTPTVLFCLLNLMIATIFITSNLKSHHKKPPPPQTEDEQTPTQLFRAQSILERVKSINFPFYNYEQPEALHQPEPPLEDSHHHQTQLYRAPSILERVKSINFSLYRSEQPEVHQPDPHHKASDHNVTRSSSDKTGEAPPPARMRKSASEKKAAEKAEEVYRRRPATVREGKQKAVVGEDEEVDEKADDFINRFKQQLKLQRLDSIRRFTAMLNRGAGR